MPTRKRFALWLCGELRRSDSTPPSERARGCSQTNPRSYHNIAVQQLLLRRSAEACVSSQNARRLARLSLSYSSRFLKQFEVTHRICLETLNAQKAVDSELKGKDDKTAQIFKDLSSALFS